MIFMFCAFGCVRKHSTYVRSAINSFDIVVLRLNRLADRIQNKKLLSHCQEVEQGAVSNLNSLLIPNSSKQRR